MPRSRDLGNEDYDPQLSYSSLCVNHVTWANYTYKIIGIPFDLKEVESRSVLSIWFNTPLWVQDVLYTKITFWNP
jgi:hypothetical protein